MDTDTSISEDLKLAVLEKIKPTEAERKELMAVQDELAAEVKAAAEKLCVPDIFVKMVGSAARGTWLSGTHDIDVFISFPEETSRKDLEIRGMGIAREVAKHAEYAEDRHAEHPYLNIVYKGFDVDLVPCFRVCSACQLKSAVDRTPFHNEFIKSRIKGREDDVLLMKQFMRGGRVYGSELKTQGFSGYLTELLIIYYGSFEKTVKAASSWKPGKKIDIMQHSELEHSEPLVMVDPTDPKRNVAAALSLDKFCMFIDHCREFLKSPEIKFFFPESPLPIEDKEFLEKLESRKTSQLAIVFETPDVVDDVLYPQLYKMEQAASSLLSEYDFSVIKTGVWSGKPQTVVMLELISGTLPNVKKRTGPPVWVREHAEKFKDKYEGAENVFGGYIENGKYVYEVHRKYTTAKGLLEEQLLNCSLGKQVYQSVNKGFEVIENAEICRLKDQDFRVFLRKWV
ncbi:CCA tRNA nucleotidyltransferase [Methanosarcina mazei]|jgi:tRNA nucleotidyltransferase (CCA-adding enzyme)|uniref:CCA-adding enzyme n=4 Tax=Methanosarcina mazei TaxID=2209 RepID=A0A0F8GAN8_METMZ|nr:CCA tRNA nucleotidyltransferase [Methanosarcina mazei]AKB39812.1 tRNA nucleotidyltransferase, archaeal type [Methanosarcina mazei WWM610]AKB64031.1 tRNA nucleotidyltransferase, archaeal type [Methanosarcina mazei S-6]AKB70704.1 tRNA nucleotidyltransferase, archaeal type [Methanosarcina mazei C16]KKG13570.1 CCA-adding protein [Methanosarcina mazei]KKG28850.1 CCA-adding protein [Methanosarcina mazei]